LLAEDQDSIAERLLSPSASPQSIAAALNSTAASLRRKAKSLPHPSLPTVSTEPSNSVNESGQSQGAPLSGTLQ
jgi:hypothetical protein